MYKTYKKTRRQYKYIRDIAPVFCNSLQSYLAAYTFKYIKIIITVVCRRREAKMCAHEKILESAWIEPGISGVASLVYYLLLHVRALQCIYNVTIKYFIII